MVFAKGTAQYWEEGIWMDSRVTMLKEGLQVAEVLEELEYVFGRLYFLLDGIVVEGHEIVF